jgi:hypothetical protein
MTMNDDRNDILERLDAMLVKEANACTRTTNYFKRSRAVVGGGGVIDESCRTAMLRWLRQVQSQLDLGADTVRIAMSIFDRYLSSGRGKSTIALVDRSVFQLAAITAFYTAVKMHEPVVLGIDMLLIVCRRAYDVDDFESMEMDILNAIDWRVSCHTAIDYARVLIELACSDGTLPSSFARHLAEDCEARIDEAIEDVGTSSCLAQSEVAMRCVASSLVENDLLPPKVREGIWMRFMDSFGSRKVTDARLASARVSGGIAPKLDVSSRRLPGAAVSSIHKKGGSSSPTCISCTARQA